MKRSIRWPPCGESRRKGHKTLGIVNVVGSTIAREVDGGTYMHAGPEIGVAATKTFTSQIATMTLLAVLMGRMRHLASTRGTEILRGLEEIPSKMERVLKQSDAIAGRLLKSTVTPTAFCSWRAKSTSLSHSKAR